MKGLHVDSVRKFYGNRQVLNDVFISCEPGEIVGLFGRNGSGKSTLLKIIFGCLQADNKYVRVDGKKTTNLADTKNLIQYLPQQNFLPANVKVKQLIECFNSPAAAGELIAHELVSPWLSSRPNQMSGGELRILEVMMIMFSETPYVLLDEPFNGISPLNIAAVKEIILSKSKDKGVIVSDHDYRNVLDISTRNILMDNGNTKVVKVREDLISLGYLPASANI